MIRSQSKDSIYVFKTVNDQDIAKNVAAGLDALGNLGLTSLSKVVIKPNLCSIKSPETGTTTNPLVVEAVIRYLQSKYGVADISIVESDGTQVLADLAFKLLGFEALSKKLNVKLVNLSKSIRTEKNFPQNAVIKRMKYPVMFSEGVFFISIPKIKTHSDCFMTCALKNQYGCIPYWRKTIYHSRLNEVIVDVNAVFPANLVVVDGMIAMDGHKGPTDGVPVRLNTLIFGRNSVSIDHYVATIMGFNPKKIEYIVKSKKRGLGSYDYTVVSGLKFDKKFNVTPPRWHNMYGMFH